MVAPLAIWAAMPLLAKIFAGTAAAGAGVGLARAATGTQMRKEEDERDPFGPSRTAFGEVMDFLTLTAQPVQNLFAGRFGAASRTFGDVGLRLADAFIPGKALPTLSKRSDIISPTELVSDVAGVDHRDVPWYVRLPVDIAGDIVTNPTSLVSFGGGGAAKSVAQTGRQLDSLGQASSSVANALSKANQGKKFIPVGIPQLQMNSANIIKSGITEGLTRSGRKQLLKSNSSVSQFVDDVFKQGGGNSDNIANLMTGKYRDFFQQGGMSVAGKQVVRPGQVSGAMDAALSGVGKSYPAVERAIRGSGAAVGRAAEPVARVATQLGGGMYGVAKPIQRAIKAAQHTGRKHHRVAARNIERMFTGVPREARDDVSDLMFNIKRSNGAFDTLLPVDSLPPFMTRDGQVAMLRDRVTAARDAGVKFGGMKDEALFPLLDDIVDQNMTLFNIDSTMGSMTPPQMWTAPDGARKTVQELLAEQDTLLRSLGDDVTKQVEVVKANRAAIDNAVDSIAKAKAAGTQDVRKLQILADAKDRAARAYDDAVEMLTANEAVRGKFDELGYKLMPIDTALESPPLYLHRIFDQADDVVGTASRAPHSNFDKARVLRDQQDFVDYLNTGAKLRTDAFEIMLKRAEQSGRSVSRQQVARNILGDEILGRDLQNVVEAGLRDLATTDPKLAQSLVSLTRPIPARKGIMKGLNTFNRFWKPAVLYGFAVPRQMVFARNRLGGIIQEAADAGANLRFKDIIPDIGRTFGFQGKQYVKAYKKFRRGVSESIVDATGITFPADRITRGVEILDAAELLAKGDFRRLGPSITEAMRRGGIDDPELARYLGEAWDNGILDGFVRTEELLKRVSRDTRTQAVFDLLDVPASTYQHIEHRMRLGQFFDLRRQGVRADEAARAVNSAYLDYSMAGLADRRMRDVIPFASFMSRSIPQQFKALSRYGAYRSGVASVYTGERSNTVLPEWVANQAHVDLGLKDDQGNPMVAAGLGNPMEVLNIFPSNLTPDLSTMSIPELGDTIRRTVLASSQPLLKESYAQVSGRDPFFGTKVGSYDKTPSFMRWFGAPERSEAGRFVQSMRRTGLAAPFEPFITQTDVISDDRTGIGAKLTRLFTGVRLVPIDEDRARTQVLQRRMETDPRIQSGEFFYTRNPNPATQQLLDAFKRSKAAQRRKRQE